MQFEYMRLGERDKKSDDKLGRRREVSQEERPSLLLGSGGEAPSCFLPVLSVPSARHEETDGKYSL